LLLFVNQMRNSSAGAQLGAGVGWFFALKKGASAAKFALCSTWSYSRRAC